MATNTQDSDMKRYHFVRSAACNKKAGAGGLFLAADNAKYRSIPAGSITVTVTGKPSVETMISAVLKQELFKTVPKMLDRSNNSRRH
jgi:hypothetical protein